MNDDKKKFQRVWHETTAFHRAVTGAAFDARLTVDVWWSAPICLLDCRVWGPDDSKESGDAVEEWISTSVLPLPQALVVHWRVRETGTREKAIRLAIAETAKLSAWVIEELPRVNAARSEVAQ